MGEDEQLELLPAGQGRPVWVDRLRPRVAYWRDQGVYFGTSSWKYEGWLGQIYSSERYRVRGRFSAPRFQRECLEEYATFFPTVCGDFTFYQFPTVALLGRLFAQVPAGFRFGFKVPEEVTCPVFPRHARYGERRGRINAHFLDHELVTDLFLDRLAPHHDRVGFLVFEFPQFARATAATNARFLEQLDGFLGRLPAGFPYGVEIRTERLLGPDYFAVLRRHGVAHVFNAWTRMPAIGRQLAMDRPFTASHAVARVLLRPGRTYEQAVQAFQPYDEVKDPYPEGYRDAAAYVRAARAAAPGGVVYLTVNNRFVGNAIRAVAEIVRELDAAAG